MSDADDAPATDPVVARTRRDLRARASGGLAQAGAREFSLAAAIGGPRGAVEAILPGLLFVVWFSISRDLRSALVLALAAAGLAVLARVVTRGNATQALSGLVGVGVCALVAARTGEARDFYLPGLLINVGYASVYAASTVPTPSFRLRLGDWRARVPRGPFPVIGLLIGPLVGEGLAWRHDPARLRAYLVVTWLWVAMFVVRLAVQLPLFLMDAVGALGAARLAMGVPLFGLTAWLTWLVLRSVPPARPAS